MAERKQRVRTYSTDYICDVCKTGTMEFTGKALACYPALYEHKCTLCPQRDNLRCAYPKITYEVIDG